MFEGVSAGSLIDEVGDAARAESVAIARRLAAVGALDALRTAELAERRWWRTDPFQEVAAEISAAQNISRGRAGNQIHLARVLRDDLPAVAAVFASGAIDLTIWELSPQGAQRICSIGEDAGYPHVDGKTLCTFTAPWQ